MLTIQSRLYIPAKCTLLGVLFTVFVNAQTKDNTHTPKEDDYYKIKTVPIPANVELEVGGMAFLPNDALAVSTRHGEVWIISNPYMKNGQLPQYRLFAHGLHEALGLNYINGDIYVTQRPELTRLRDLDGDGEADEYKTVATWPLAGNYHEYAYGPAEDKDGNFVITKNLGWIGYGASLSKWDGWMLKISPEGQIKPYATGLRSPAGFAYNNAGDIFYSENQGDWVGSGGITHLEEGDFAGNPGGLVWADQPGSPVKLRKADIPDTHEPKYEVAKRVPGLKTPTVWFPHALLGISTSAIISADKKANIGPFEDQLFVGDQGHSKIMRVFLEKVKGVYQGAVFPFRQGFSSGILRMNWGSDGSMFVGMTARGWSATGTDDYGLQRLEWTGKIPFEIKSIKARPDGFELEFTKPVDVRSAKNSKSYDLATFTYQYHHNYGSPVINNSKRSLKAISVSSDKLKVRLVLDSLKEGYIHQIKADGILSSDDSRLLHDVGYYTLNQLPEGEKLAITAENRVSAPVAHVHTAKAKEAPKVAVKSTSKHLTTQPQGWTEGPDKAFVLGTKPGLKFDTELLTVKAGDKVKITFKNDDDMLHNFVITTPGSGVIVGELAGKLGLNGEKLNYVPNSPAVLFYTRLLQPNESDTIYFTAPSKPGDYTFECTYPGHYLVMKGIFKVTQ